MITLEEPKKHIADLWSKPEVRDGVVFRLMRYLLRVDCDDEILLHNVVTGQLVALNHDEKVLLDQLPMEFTPAMSQLIDGHYLVAEQFDEHHQVVGMRTVLRKLNDSQKSDYINHYTILPTTACNARCYYCFEHGVKKVTMSEKTANDVVQFISEHYDNNKKVSIMWFGGEPTVAANRIDQISKGLQDKGLAYRSTMVSNGYLFDEELVKKAKNLWNLKRIQISVDGVGDHYNEVKDYINAENDPFERVMRNIGLLLENEILVDLRMNFDLNNYLDFQALLQEALKRFKSSRFLQVYAYPVIGEYPDKNGKILHGDDEWRATTEIILNSLAREAKLYGNRSELPFLKYTGCGADDDHAITITAEGRLVECPEHFDQGDSVGTVEEDITDGARVQDWHKIADHPRCVDCEFFPYCVRLQNCSAGNNCYFQDRNQQYYEAVKSKYSVWKAQDKKIGGKQNGIQ